METRGCDQLQIPNKFLQLKEQNGDISDKRRPKLQQS